MANRKDALKKQVKKQQELVDRLKEEAKVIAEEKEKEAQKE